MKYLKVEICYGKCRWQLNDISGVVSGNVGNNRQMFASIEVNFKTIKES